MSGRPTISADLSDPAVFSQGIPQAAFAELRATPGLVWSPVSEPGQSGFWSVGRYEDLCQVSLNPETFSSARGHVQIYDIDEDALAHRASMIDMDPPEHTRLRRIVMPSFSPKQLKIYADGVRAHVGHLLDQAERLGTFDWVELISKPIPIRVICNMLGVPAQDHEFMIELTDHLVAGTSGEPLDPTAYGNTTPLRLLPFNSPAAYALTEYADRLAAAKRACPGDDLVSLLSNCPAEGDQLTQSEITNFFRLLVFAGNETTRSAMSHLAVQLARFPDAFALLREDPRFIDSAVEEVVRYASPILYFRRTVTQRTELSGTVLEPGDKVVMWYASANFDESRFPDALRFDVARPPKPAHLGFGGRGVHHCLGANLARLELKILLEEIIAQGLQISLAEHPTYVMSNFVNGIERLKVRVSTMAAAR